MSMKIKAAILVSSFAVLLFVVVGSLGGVHASSNDGSYRQMQVYSEVLSRVQSEYVEDPNIPKVTDGALHGLVESLDANSSYLTPAAYKAYKAHKSEAKGEIGATVSKRFGYADVVSVLPGSPAEKAGIEDTDIFESIEGQSTRDMSLPEIREALAGTPGSTVNVSVVRARRAEPQKMSITRDMVSIPPVSDKMLEDGIGYVKVDALTKGKAQEIAGEDQVAGKIRSEEAGAGFAEHVGGRRERRRRHRQSFPEPRHDHLSARTEVSARGVQCGSGEGSDYASRRVLVNKGTAGAAEIVAAAMLENARGDVVGDKTFGDGSVQKTIDLPDGGALILSVAKYYSPSGKAIQETAVTPNVLVADETDNVISDDEDAEPAAAEPEAKPKNTQDDQLHKAVEVLKSRSS